MIGARGIIQKNNNAGLPLYADAPGVITPFQGWMLLIANRQCIRLMPTTPFERLAVHLCRLVCS